MHGAGVGTEQICGALVEARRLLPCHPRVGGVGRLLAPSSGGGPVTEHGCHVPVAGQVGQRVGRKSVVALDRLRHQPVQSRERRGAERRLDRVADHGVHELVTTRRLGRLDEPGVDRFLHALEHGHRGLVERSRDQADVEATAGDRGELEHLGAGRRAAVKADADRTTDGVRHAPRSSHQPQGGAPAR